MNEPASKNAPASNRRYKPLIAVVGAVALAFGIAIPAGFWIHATYPAIPDQMLVSIVVIGLVGIAAAATRVLNGPFPPRRRMLEDHGRPSEPDSFDTPRTGYEMTFDDFRALLSKPTSQCVVAPLLKAWYGYEIAGAEGRTVVRSQDGRAIALRVLHRQIQADPAKQYSIYQEAMNLWR